jgi:pimeloyl-ACP methyl ester carboxylesterase
MIKNQDNTQADNKKAKGNYASINGLAMYYEIHGKGMPLVLLHGGLMTIEAIGPLLPALAQSRQVIAVELEGHGHTADINRTLSFEQMADDVAALIKQLGLEDADILGYSLGGGVALQTTIRHPKMVRKMAVVSAVFRSDGWYPEIRAGMRSMNTQAAEAMVGSPMHQAYISTAPNPADWPTLVTKLGQLVGQDYDWSTDIAQIKAPTLIVVGDADSIRPTHAAEFFGLLGGGKKDAGWDGSGMPNTRLAILPATTHYNIIFSQILESVVISFLDAPMPKEK